VDETTQWLQSFDAHLHQVYGSTRAPDVLGTLRQILTANGEAMGKTKSDSGHRFYARMSDDDELGGIKVNHGVTAVLMELDAEGSVRRFVCVDEKNAPLSRWPSRRPPPFMFCDGMYHETCVLEEYLNRATEFEAKWSEAATLDRSR
jgi:hypothetical protein